jgi:hypothetical protein
VRQEEITEFAQEKKLYYIETSALNASNVDKAFMTILKCKLGLLQRFAIRGIEPRGRPQ